MSRMNLFIPISKVDVETRTVYGVATSEDPDRSGEIMDYASTKPYFESWSGEVSKATGGKSLGNVRAMHGKVAAGKLTAINFDDTAKKIEVAAKVVDDAEWEKVVEGVYTGFSQGGKYVKRWPDESTGLMRYTAEPHEISLVDLPCLPGATFQVIKASGAETKAFSTIVAEPDPAAVQERAQELAKGATGKTWRDFLEPAIADLMEAAAKAAMKDKMKVDPPLDADEDMASSKQDEDKEVDGETEAQAANDHIKEMSPEAAAAHVSSISSPAKAAKVYEPAQFWACNCKDHKHEKKADAIKCMKAEDAEAMAKAATSPLAAALDRVERALGLEKAVAVDPLAAVVEALFPAVAKRVFSADDRKAAAKAGTAMPDGSFPIENKQDLENAVRAFGRAKDKDAAKAHIEARAKTLGCEDCLPADWKDASKMAAGALAKGLSGVAQYAQTVQQLAWCYQDAMWERAYEGDASTVPDDLCHILRAAGEALLRMAAEEVGELMPDGAEPTLEQSEEMANGAGLNETAADALHKLAASGVPFAALSKFEAQDEPIKKLFASLEKKGARNSKSDQSKIQQIHDHSMALGAGCSMSNCGKDVGENDDLAKLASENATLKDEMAKATARFEGIADALTKRIANLEAQPAPAKAAITVVAKGAGLTAEDEPTGAKAQDMAEKALDAMKPQERAHFLMKAALRTPTEVKY